MQIYIDNDFDGGTYDDGEMKNGKWHDFFDNYRDNMNGEWNDIYKHYNSLNFHKNLEMEDNMITIERGWGTCLF
ncbi:unnamed protein product [Paramecium primaurelia]|uniref:Uncharacterized protein n=1 Tax=Paramecium primaurelia TaxID=5886 RepID=A0A8S1QTU3_PARPR|nr:unnamed protein product [Paramecium primaurelia]